MLKRYRGSGRRNLIFKIVILIAMVVGTYALVAENNKKHECLIRDIKETNISSYTDEQKKKLYDDIKANKNDEDEKNLILGYVEYEKNHNITQAKEYFELGKSKIDKYTCSLTKHYLNMYLGKIAFENNEFDSGLEYYIESLESIEEENYETSYEIIYETLKDLRVIDKGIDFSTEFLEGVIKSNLSTTIKVKYMRLLASTYTLEFDYLNAIDLTLQVIDITSLDGYKYGLNIAAIDLAMIARDLGGYEIAINALMEVNSAHIEDSNQVREIEFNKNINLAQISNILNKEDEARSYMAKLKEYEDYLYEDGKESLYCLINIVMAESYIKEDITKAREYLDKAKDLLEIASKKYLDIESYFNIVLGKINLEESNYKEAEINFKTSLEHLGVRPSYEYEKICLEYLIKIYTYLDDVENIEKYAKILEAKDDEDDTKKTKNYFNYMNYRREIKVMQEHSDAISFAILFLSLFILALLIFIIKIFIYPFVVARKNKATVLRYMNNNNYFLNYQPIINPNNDKIVGFEALLRLKRGDKIIYPDESISQIEKSKMMPEVSVWILEKLLEDFKQISTLDNVVDDFYLSMNVTLREIENNSFCDEFIKILKESHIQKGRICIEITENVSGEDYERIVANIRRLMYGGFIIALDDFGVDYSNLSFLEKLDFNVVKLDKYFIDNYSESKTIQSLVEFLCGLAKRINVKLVLEGVEDEEQLRLIKELKSDRIYIQGYYYSKPLDIEKLDQLDIYKRS